MDEFVLRALLGGIGAAAVAGPLGCFVVWRRMAYFGATLSHGALLGVALGILFDLGFQTGILVVSVALSLLLMTLQNQRRLASDTLLGILAHAALAAGLIVLSLMPTARIDLMGYLFGDILAVTWTDVAWVYLGGVACLLLLALLWRRLLAVTLHAELAQVEGVPLAAVNLVFMLMISAVIAVAMQITGLLLIVSLLIIPAATARRVASGPETMALIASAVGVIAVVTGLWASMQWDTPAGPSIVIAATLLFAVGLIVPATS